MGSFGPHPRVGLGAVASKVRYIPTDPAYPEGHVDVNRQPEIGEIAPPIKATTATGEPFDLAEHLGGYVVIWVFPRANTPG